MYVCTVVTLTASSIQATLLLPFLLHHPTQPWMLRNSQCTVCTYCVQLQTAANNFFPWSIVSSRFGGRSEQRESLDTEPLREFFSFFDIHKAKISRVKSNFFSGVQYFLNKFSPGIKKTFLKLKNTILHPFRPFALRKKFLAKLSRRMNNFQNILFN